MVPPLEFNRRTCALHSVCHLGCLNNELISQVGLAWTRICAPQVESGESHDVLMPLICTYTVRDSSWPYKKHEEGVGVGGAGGGVGGDHGVHTARYCTQSDFAWKNGGIILYFVGENQD